MKQPILFLSLLCFGLLALADPVLGQSMHFNTRVASPISDSELGLNELYHPGYGGEWALGYPWIRHEAVRINLIAAFSFSGYAAKEWNNTQLNTLYLSTTSVRVRASKGPGRSFFVESGFGVTHSSIGFNNSIHRDAIRDAIGDDQVTDASFIGGLGYQWPMADDLTVYVMAEYQRLAGERGANLLVGRLGFGFGRL